MIHLHNHNVAGFTIFEALAALFLFSFVLGSVLVLQQHSYDAIVDYSQRLRRVFYMRNALVDSSFLHAQSKKPKDKQEIGPPPETTIMYKEEAISDKSSLKNFKHIVMQKVTASWMDGNRKKEETLIGFRFKPEKKE